MTTRPLSINALKIPAKKNILPLKLPPEYIVRIGDDGCNLRVKPWLTIAFYLLDRLRRPIAHYRNKCKLREGLHKHVNQKACAQRRVKSENHAAQKANPNVVSNAAVQVQKWMV